MTSIQAPTYNDLTMAHEIEIILSNPLNSGDCHTIWINLYDTPVAKKFQNMLARALEKKLHLEKSFCFVGFPSSPRNLTFLCQELSTHILQINLFSETGKWPSRYRIVETYAPESVFNGRELNQSLMNALHHHFEILQGQSWNISPYFKLADIRTRFSIRKLNLLCHEIESLCHAMMKEGSPQGLHPATLVGFLNSEKELLTKDDKRHFRLEKGFGLVNLAYCQVGKTHWEAFEHDDEVVGDEGISGLKYVSPEFNILWGEEAPGLWDRNRKHLHQWLESKGVTPEDPELSLGWLYVGEVDRKASFGDRSVVEIQKHLSTYLNIAEMRVHFGDKVSSCRYSYSFIDHEFNELQFELFKKDFAGH